MKGLSSAWPREAEGAQMKLKRPLPNARFESRHSCVRHVRFVQEAEVRGYLRMSLLPPKAEVESAVCLH